MDFIVAFFAASDPIPQECRTYREPTRIRALFIEQMFAFEARCWFAVIPPQRVFFLSAASDKYYDYYPHWTWKGAEKKGSPNFLFASLRCAPFFITIEII